MKNWIGGMKNWNWEMKNWNSGPTAFRAMVCATVLALAAVAGAQKSDWKPYSYPADGFRATYPAMPQLNRRNIPTNAGSFELRSYVAELGSAALTISVCDYGAKATGKDPQIILQGVKNAATKNTNASVISEKKISLGNNPGIEFQARSENAQFTARVYLVGSVMYQTLVIAPLDKPLAESARFLDSFQLIPKTAN